MIRYRNLTWLFLGAAGLWVVAVLFALAKFWNIASPLIIQFDVFRGITILGSKSLTYRMLAIAGVLLAINGILANSLVRRQLFLSYLIGACTILIMLWMFASVAATAHINL